MSIELQNPETLLGKVDAAANFVSQIRIALAVGDWARIRQLIEQAERLLFNAVEQIEQQEAK